MQFKYIIRNYWRSLSTRDIIIDFGFPLFVTLTIIIGVMIKCELDLVPHDYNSNLSFISILVGFSITSIAVLASSDNRSLKRLKELKSKLVVSRRRKSIFHSFLTSLAYSVVVGLFLLLLNYLGKSIESINIYIKIVFYLINIYLILHLLMVSIRNISFFYFTFFNQDSAEN